MLDGKVCLVTGGGRGIGRATVLHLVQQHAKVLAVARTKKQLNETRAQAGPNCEILAADVTRPDQCRSAVSACRERFGRLDALINNAGLAPRATIEKFSDRMLHEMVAVNINAVVYLCRAAWPLLKRSRGTIINVSSMSACDPFPGLAIYGGTKAWVNTFTQGLANEGKPLGIRVFAVAPGAVETAMLRKGFPDFPVEQTLPPERIAEAMGWLLQDGCRFMTGQTFAVRA